MINEFNYDYTSAYTQENGQKEMLFADRWGYLTKNPDGGWIGENHYKVAGEGYFAWDANLPWSDNLVDTYEIELGEIIEATAVTWDQRLEPGTGHTFTGLEGPLLGVSGVLFNDEGLYTGNTSAMERTSYDFQHVWAIDYYAYPAFINTPVPGVALVREDNSVHYNPFGYPVRDEFGNVVECIGTPNIVLSLDVLEKLQKAFYATSSRDYFHLDIPKSVLKNIEYTSPIDPEVGDGALKYYTYDEWDYYEISYKIGSNVQPDADKYPSILVQFDEQAFEDKSQWIKGEIIPDMA